MKEKDTLAVWVESTPHDVKAALPTLKQMAQKTVEVSADLLAENLRTFLASFRAVVGEEPATGSDFAVTSIELNLAINAEGGIEMIGKLSAGAQASMKVTLTRKPTK